MKDIDKNKKKKIISVFLVAFIIVLVIAGLVAFKNYRHKEEIKKNSSIDFNSETYKGKEIKIQGNKVIIKEENGSETIETVDLNGKDKMTTANKDIKSKFAISNLSVNNKAAKTIITGEITAKTSKYKKAVVTATFKRNDVVTGTASSIVDVKKDEVETFEITLLGDYSDSIYDVSVEYVD